MKKGLRKVFLFTIYLSGIVIGNVYTPEVIAYAKNTYNDKAIEKIKKVKPPVKQKYRRSQLA